MLAAMSALLSRATARLARQAVPELIRAGRDPRTREAMLTAVGRRLLRGAAAREGEPARHPLAPAAVRIERSRQRQGRAAGDHVAVTLWFGQGPDLAPPLWARPAARRALRLGAGVAGAATLGRTSPPARPTGARGGGAHVSTLPWKRTSPPSRQPSPGTRSAVRMRPASRANREAVLAVAASRTAASSRSCPRHSARGT